MPEFKDNANIPYLFNALSDEEKESVFQLQDFMTKYKDEIPKMSILAMMHYLAVQLNDIVDKWADLAAKEKEAIAPVTEDTRRFLNMACYAQFIAFVLAHKNRLSNSSNIIKTVDSMLKALYGDSEK